MLAEVDIADFAIIREARVELGPGLCVLTGETGAGKSIIIDAIGALLGERTGPEVIRAGAEAARLSALFDLTDAPAATERLAELGWPAEPDGSCLITREITAGGRNRCSLNGRTVTVGMLRRLGEVLLDIHGQHEHQSLLRVATHLQLLDAAGGAAIEALRSAYRATYDRWQAVGEELAHLRDDEGALARRADMLRFQVDEIDAARLVPGEEEELRTERNRLQHAERLVAAAAAAYGALAESEEAPPAATRVADALAQVRDMARFDASLAPLAADLEAALATVQEAARTLSGYADDIDADPHRLDEAEQRLDQIERLRRKYGETVADMLAFGERAREELDSLDGLDERVAALERQRAALEVALAAQATALSEGRAVAGEAMTQGVVDHLADLGMARAHFAVALTRRPPGDGLALRVGQVEVGAGPDGIDRAELLFSANPSEPPRALARIASGGEVSRVMLALKSQLAAADQIPTMVFDEIDVGIGGVTIHDVARKMAALAARHQVICITHHAPIAAWADVHQVIEKAPGDDSTLVVVHRLEGEQRVHELARMLGKHPPTAATLAMARELMAAVH